MTTQFSENVKNAAINLRNILRDDNMAPFNDMVPMWPGAGRFDLAVWLEIIVDDRRNAIVAHANHLRLAFTSMSATLEQIAKDFENRDGENAKKIRDILGEMKGTIEGEWEQLDSTTENEQGNFTGNGRPGAPPGDGYSANQNNPISGGPAPAPPPDAV